jgi:hypothetical protein
LIDLRWARRDLRCLRVGIQAATGLITLVALLASPERLDAAGPPAWREVARDDDGNRYFVDKSSIDREGQQAAALVRTDFARPQKSSSTAAPVFAHIDALIVDCAQLAAAIEVRTLRLANGDEVVLPPNARAELRFYRAQPGTTSEKVLNSICSPGARR